MRPVAPPVEPDYGSFVARANDTRILAWLRQVRDRFRFVGTLGLPEAADRTDFPIERLYVPLAVGWPEGEEQRLTRQPEVLVAARQRVVLLGEAGTGKTTFACWLSYRLAEVGRNEVHRRIGEVVPLSFVLRDLPVTDRVSTWEDLHALLAEGPHWAPELDEVLPTLLGAGQVLFIFDGWDEIADTRIRRALRDAVQDAMHRFPACAFLLTSRPAGFDDVPLDLLRAQVQPFDDGQVQAFAQAWYGWRSPDQARERAASLVATLHADPGLLALARVPNLLAMLAVLHRHAPRLPNTRVELLARVTDAFVEGWEAPKGQPPPAAPVAVRRRWLQELALVMNRRRVWGPTKADLALLGDRSDQAAERFLRLQSGTVIRREQAEQLLAELAWDGPPGTGPDDARAFLDWCLRRSGLLVPRSPDTLAFAHLSLQDWLCAGAMISRLRSGWLDPGLARRTAAELGRWAMRAAGGDTLLLVLDQLGQEQPELAEQLVVEVFTERAGYPAQHRRLLDLAAQVDALDQLLPDMDCTRRVDDGKVFRGLDRLDPQVAAGAEDVLYLVDCPALVELAPLANRPRQGPTRRTIYLVETGVRSVPADFPWRVVDEHGVVYTPEDGPVRAPHERPAAR